LLNAVPACGNGDEARPINERFIAH